MCCARCEGEGAGGDHVAADGGVGDPPPEAGIPERCERRYGYSRLPDTAKVKHGDWWTCHEYGQWKRRCHYVNGLLHGTCVTWSFDEEKTSECSYQMGQQHGRCATWGAGGRLVYDCTFVYGKPVGTCTEWYANGRKKNECTDIPGGTGRTCTVWYETGQKSHEQTYVGGLFTWTWWHENGQKRQEHFSYNRRSCGIWRQWDKSGKLTWEKDRGPCNPEAPPPDGGLGD